MKKTIITALLLAFGIISFAQTKQIKFGVKAGVTLPTMSSTSEAQAYDGPSDYDFKTNTSFYVGGIIDIPVSRTFSIQPGITLLGKGGKAQVYFSNFEPGPGLYIYEGSYKLSTMYLEVPVNAVFNFNVGRGNVFFGGGPSYGFAISGKINTDGTVTNGSGKSNQSIERDAEFGTNKDFKRGDFGVGFLAGYQLNSGLNLHAGYSLGLSNIDSDAFQDTKLTNRVLSLGIGFSF